MITKIVPEDVFTNQLQPGEIPGEPIDIICATNTHGVNTRGVASQIARGYVSKFANLLQGTGQEAVELGTVFSESGKIDTQDANFHAIVTNTRTDGGQDWGLLSPSLEKGFAHLHLMNDIYGDGGRGMVDEELRAKLAGVQIQESSDYAVEIARLTREHIEATRRKFRVVLIGGGDGVKNGARLQETLEAMENTPLILHLYLGREAAVAAAAIRKVIPMIPALRARELMVA